MTNSDIAKLLGSAGGKKSVISRLSDKTPEEVSEIMRKIRKAALTKDLKNDKN